LGGVAQALCRFLSHAKVGDLPDIIPLMPLPHHLQKALDAILARPGETDAVLRRAILEQPGAGAEQIPEVLRPLLEKIAERAWTVSDEDFAELLVAGYSEGQLFEVTFAAALGAGVQRFKAGLRALGENL